MEKLIYNLVRLIVGVLFVIYGINWVYEKIDEYATESAWKKINQNVEVKPIPHRAPTPRYKESQYTPTPTYKYEEKPRYKGEWITEPCEYCNKTGYSLSDREYHPNLYGERLTYWCDICKRNDYSHYHKPCPHCQGLGYTKRYVD